MGFFSKVFKGIKKVFKKVGRGLKKVVGKIGKFMGKIGIVGQIGLSLLLPGIGAMFGKLAGAMMGSSSAIISGAGQVLNAAVNIGSKVGSAFKTITEGVTKVIGDVAGAALNKIPGAGDLLKSVTGGKLDITSKTFSGAWKTAQSAITDVAAAGKDLFSMETLTSPNQYLKDVATKQVTEAAREQVLSSVPDSLASSEAASTSLFDLPSTGLQQTEGAEFFSGAGQALQSPVVPEGAAYSPSLLEPPTAQTGVPTTNVKGFVQQKVEDIVTTAKELPGKFVDEVIAYGKDIPTNIVTSVESGIESGIKSKTLSALGVETRPEYNVTQVSGYVPTIDMSETTNIGMLSSEPFDAVTYMQNNSDMINMNPYGYSANIYNAASYQQRMKQYGFAV